MPQPTQLLPQFTLRTFFELVTGVALAIAAFRLDSLYANWLVFAFFAVYVTRVRDLPLRWSLMVCFGGMSAVFFGLMCLQVAFNGPPLRQSHLDYLAFLGPMISGCGVGLAIIGTALAVRCLLGFRVQPALVSAGVAALPARSSRPSQGEGEVIAGQRVKTSLARSSRLPVGEGEVTAGQRVKVSMVQPDKESSSHG